VKSHRFDIQLLRGIAVLLVVAFHAWGGWFPRGFLGVDVFFVVSGFLITGMILRDLESGSFGFRNFYLRRARRLIPASMATLALTTVLALLFLTGSQLREFGAQLLGSILFVANIVLALQSGYFETAAAAKPLLHMWSLSLEEQFYFIAPVLLWITPARFRLPVLVIGLAASLVLCMMLMAGPAWLPTTAAGAQKLAFFMLPARAWELLAGALAAWLMIRRPGLAVPRALKLGALGLVFFVCTMGFIPCIPGIDALVVVVATCALLLGQDDWLPRAAPLRQLARIGDWSYSLYLLHWPLFAVAYVVYGGHPPAAVLAVLASLALILAWAQYTWIEQPLRRPGAAGGFARTALLAGSVATLGAVSVHFMNVRPAVQFASSHGFDQACDQKFSEWQDIPACRSDELPRMAIWGDSYAMHYVPGLADAPIIQMTRSACAPIHGVANVGGEYTRSWAQGCADFNRSVVNALASMPSVEIVLISSPFAQVLKDSGQSLLVDGEVSPWSPVGAARLSATLQELKTAGKRPILIAPTPPAGFDAGVCNERLVENRLSLGRNGCDIDRAEAARRSASVIELLHQAAAMAGAEVLDPATVLCGEAICRTREGASVLYADGGHLTDAGSRFVAEGLGLRRLALD